MTIKGVFGSLRIHRFMITPSTSVSSVNSLKTIQKEEMFLENVPSKFQVTYILTKTLAKGVFDMIRYRISLIEKKILENMEC